jgi:phenylalanyl-tRNA synthetase beta chain
MNVKAGYDEFALFELGKAHNEGQNSGDGLPREDELTALVVAASDKRRKSGTAYYVARKYLSDLLPVELTFKPVPAAMQQYAITKPYDMNRTAFVYAGETFLGLVGEFRGEVRRNLKLPHYCAGFELDTEALSPVLGQNKYVPLPRFPKVTQDMTLKVPAELPYQELQNFVWQNLSQASPDQTLPRLEPRGIYQSEADMAHKQVTFRYEIASYERTLTDQEINNLLDAAAAAAREKFGAERV